MSLWVVVMPTKFSFLAPVATLLLSDPKSMSSNPPHLKHPVHPFLCPSISIHLSTHTFAHPSVCPSFTQLTHSSIRPSTYLYLYPFDHPIMYSAFPFPSHLSFLSVHPFFLLFIHLVTYPLSFPLSTHKFFHPPIKCSVGSCLQVKPRL